MSTKIFVHKQLKVKPPKPPDPNLDRMFAEAVARREAEKTRREQNRRIMAELRNEELQRRAEKMPPPTPRNVINSHCRYCWGMETTAAILGTNNKVLDRFYRAIVFDRRELLDNEWLKAVQLGLAYALRQTARYNNVALTDEEIAQLAVRTCERSLEALAELEDDKRARRERLALMGVGNDVPEPTHLRLLIERADAHECVAEEIKQ